MDQKTVAAGPHPEGEGKILTNPHFQLQPIIAKTLGGRVEVQWDDSAEVTPFGQLAFFAQFLETSGLFEQLVSACPLSYTSKNAPTKADILGTVMLGILCGHKRYAHLASLRFDSVSPKLLGIQRMMSEDSIRRAMQAMDEEQALTWVRDQIIYSCRDLLGLPWILDIDSTVKLIYGRQEGAAIGYNPQKKGRPSQVYHSYFVGKLRLCLGVDVEPGNMSDANYALPGLWRVLDSLGPDARPHLLRGDCGFGRERLMLECEQRDLCYLFKLKQTRNVQSLLRKLEKTAAWEPDGHGWEVAEDTLRLSGWQKERRVIVVRRPRKDKKEKTPSSANSQGAGNELAGNPDPDKQPSMTQPLLLSFDEWEQTKSGDWEYAVLVTNLDFPATGIGQLYRDRGDAENGFDELKNQWGWSGFTTQDLKRTRIMACLIALVFNWWTLYVALVNNDGGPGTGKRAESSTSRPALLHGVGRMTHSGRKSILILSTQHAQRSKWQEKITKAASFMIELLQGAEQLFAPQRWKLMLARICLPFLTSPVRDNPQLLAC